MLVIAQASSYAGSLISLQAIQMAQYLLIWYMRNTLSPDTVRKLKDELGELEREFVDIDGRLLKPSQCYRFHVDPVHVLFNTNCPDSLKKRINTIIAKYTKGGEN